MARPSRREATGKRRRRDETVAESGAIGAFLGGLEISPVKGTRLVEIIYSSPDPSIPPGRQHRGARDVQQNLDSKLENTNSTLDWLKDELDKQRKKVETPSGRWRTIRRDRMRCPSTIARTSSSTV